MVMRVCSLLFCRVTATSPVTETDVLAEANEAEATVTTNPEVIVERLQTSVDGLQNPTGSEDADHLSRAQKNTKRKAEHP